MPTPSQRSGEGTPQLLFQVFMGIALTTVLQALLDGAELLDLVSPS